MFREWQQADWASEFYDAKGAQPRAEASRANELYNPAQREWFCNFLDRIYLPV